MTDYSKTQLAQILSAIDEQPRRPANKAAALAALANRAEQLGLKLGDILTAAEGLLDGRMSAPDFRAMLLEPEAETPVDAPASEPEPAKKANGKQALIIELMRRPEGATIEQLAEAAGWQKHSVRGLISAKLNKQHAISKQKAGSCTVYRLA